VPGRSRGNHGQLQRHLVAPPHSGGYSADRPSYLKVRAVEPTVIPTTGRLNNPPSKGSFNAFVRMHAMESFQKTVD
jgi:hypothetical protein